MSFTTKIVVSSRKIEERKYSILNEEFIEKCLDKMQNFINTSEELLECPIKKEKFIKPVVASDGFTYEEDAIDIWSKDHLTSPLTRKFLFRIFYKNNVANDFKLLLNDIKVYLKLNNIDEIKFEENIDLDELKSYEFKIIKIKKRKYIKLNTYNKNNFYLIKLYEVILDICNFIRIFLNNICGPDELQVIGQDGKTYNFKTGKKKFTNEYLWHNMFLKQLSSLYDETTNSIYI